MTPQNINEIYAVIKIVDGKECGLMQDFDATPLIALRRETQVFLKETAKQRIRIEKEGMNADLGGLLVKFTNREVISVFGGGI